MKKAQKMSTSCSSSFHKNIWHAYVSLYTAPRFHNS